VVQIQVRKGVDAGTYSKSPFDEEVDYILLTVIAVRQSVRQIQGHNVMKSDDINVSPEIQQQSDGV